jgi:hypothetical protein
MRKTAFQICRDDTIRKIQEKFSHFYPVFQINFFSSNKNILSGKSCVMFSPEVRVRDINPNCQDGCIELKDDMTVAEVENLFRDHFRLHAEISSLNEKQSFTTPETEHFMLKLEYSVRTYSSEKTNPVYF